MTRRFLCGIPVVFHTIVIGACSLMQMRYLTHVPFVYLFFKGHAEKWVEILSDN